MLSARKISVSNFRAVIHATLMEKVFQQQRKYWHKKLQSIIDRIAIRNGRDLDAGPYAVHYANRNWFTEDIPKNAPKHVNVHACLMPPDDDPEIEKELIEVCAELAEIEIEEYEADRFLSNLIVFPAPGHVFERILGSQLYETCKESLREFTPKELNRGSWDQNSEVALTTYVEKYSFIIEAMKSRLMLNLLTRGL